MVLVKGLSPLTQPSLAWVIVAGTPMRDLLAAVLRCVEPRLCPESLGNSCRKRTNTPFATLRPDVLGSILDIVLKLRMSHGSQGRTTTLQAVEVWFVQGPLPKHVWLRHAGT